MRILGWGLMAGVLLLSSCAEHLQMHRARWSTGPGEPPRPSRLPAKIQTLTVGEQTLRFDIQKWGDVPIEDSYFKEITGPQGTQFVTYNWAERFPSILKANLLLMKTQRNFVEKEFRKLNPDMFALKMDRKPMLVVRHKQAYWKFVFELADGRLQAIYADSHLRPKEKMHLGSSFATAQASVFPEGPLKSQLQKVLLEGLVDSRTLTSPKFHVVSRSNVQAVSENSQFVFPLEDRRFEQVQVFYYLAQAFEWTEKNLQFKLPFFLETEMSVGFPEKTNTAFYFDGRIRLGDGDETAFSRIPLDPSIVIHEYFHSVIDAVSKLPHEGEGGSVNEAYADFFTVSLLGNPNLGEVAYKKSPFKRTVKNSMNWGETNGGLYHDSGIVSGLFWSIRTTLGAESSVQLAWKVLLRLTPDTTLSSFRTELLEVVRQLPKEQQIGVQSVLKERGWTE